MDATAAYALPDNDHLFQLEERIRFFQEIACRLFAAQDWWRAFRAMARVEALSRALPPSPDPAAAFAAALRGGNPVQPPPTSVDLRTADLTGNTPEQNHAIYVAALRDLRAKAAQVGQPSVTDAEMFAWFERHHGNQVAAGVARLLAQRSPPAPSG